MRVLLLVIVLVFALATSAEPNLVFISVDTLRADYLGAYGHTGGTSPFLDRLAAKGLVFENAITPMPVTTPSHSSMLTSVLPWRHGSIGNAVPMNGSRETLAEVLKRAGYRMSASIGVPIIGRNVNSAPSSSAPRRRSATATPRTNKPTKKRRS